MNEVNTYYVNRSRMINTYYINRSRMNEWLIRIISTEVE